MLIQETPDWSAQFRFEFATSQPSYDCSWLKDEPWWETLVSRTTAIVDQHFSENEKTVPEEGLFALLTSFPDVIFVKDRHSRYVYVNTALCELFNRPGEEIIGCTDQELFGTDDVSEILKSDRQVLSGETVHVTHQKWIRGQRYDFQCVKCPFPATANEELKIFGTSRDVTDLKKTDQQLEDSHIFLESLIENASNGICVVGLKTDPPGFQLRIWNTYLENLTGYQKSEVNSEEFFNLIFDDPEVLTRARSLIHQTISGEEIERGTWPIRTKSGSRKHIRLSTSRLTDRNNNPVIAVFAENVTQEREHQKKILANQERYRLVTRNARISVWEWDYENGQVFDDGNLSRMLGMNREDLNSIQFWLDLIHPDDLPDVLRHCERLINGESDTLSLLKRMKHFDGHWVWIETQGQIAMTESGRKIAVGTDFDVTGLKKSQQQLQELQNEIHNSSRLATIGEMAMSLVHDVSQPITAIANNCSIARRHIMQVGSPQLQDLTLSSFASMDQNLEIVTHILQGLRGFLDIDIQSRQPHSANTLISDAIALFHPQLSHPEIVWRTELLEVDQIILVNRPQIIHALLNLLHNAVESLPTSGNERPTVTVTIRPQEDEILISVTDNGPGVEQEIRQKIFDTFFTTKGDGMGMGLSICRTLVEANGGILTLEDRSAPGASFQMKFPGGIHRESHE